ncbi:hypothetical protein NXC12_CH01054 [Rhizobium etli]|uniref:Uncharacterized protein n=1 Tax=Rhizobium etli TaxID=29449 RepID=A0AAN1EJ67_RHIET|nr:hypothetical protein NXC12_CH01054 [Rhizobium etli]
MVKPLLRLDNLICAERQANRVIGGGIVDDGAMGGGTRSAFLSADRWYWDDGGEVVLGWRGRGGAASWIAGASGNKATHTLRHPRA